MVFYTCDSSSQCTMKGGDHELQGYSHTLFLLVDYICVHIKQHSVTNTSGDYGDLRTYVVEMGPSVFC